MYFYENCRKSPSCLSKNMLDMAGKVWYKIHLADVAQLVEQLICNQLVGGSTPLVGLI